MMSSNIYLYFFSAVLIICSCYAASEDKNIGKEYLNFKGEVISYDDERHPQKMCTAALGPHGIWNNRGNPCSHNVICQIEGLSADRFAIQLNDMPKTGVICDYIWGAPGIDYLACIEGKCTVLNYEDERRQ